MVNNDCEDKKACTNNKCQPVTCPSYQLIEHHTCINIENIQYFLGYVKNNRYIYYFSSEGVSDYWQYFVIGGSFLIAGIVFAIWYLQKIYSIHQRPVIQEKTRKDLKKKKFCTKCGSKLKENAKFCTKCGHYL
ncbi:zinc ribbon domain-containing protein [Candidatus Woesearchaeota archaeon]|nr:zinc ribbon domain-containing protein [Candidatus Woesearchaeota archaeon]